MLPPSDYASGGLQQENSSQWRTRREERQVLRSLDDGERSTWRQRERAVEGGKGRKALLWEKAELEDLLAAGAIEWVSA